MPRLQLTREINIPRVEEYLDSLFAKPLRDIATHEQIEGASFGGEAALIQLLFTWAKHHPTGQLWLKSSATDADLAHFIDKYSKRAFGFVAMLMASNVLTADGRDCRPLAYKACESQVNQLIESVKNTGDNGLETDGAAEDAVSQAVYGHRTFLPCVDHSTKASIAPFYHPNGRFRQRSEFRRFAEVLIGRRASRFVDDNAEVIVGFGQLYGQGIVRANYREAGSSNASRELFLDLLPLFSTDLFNKLDGFLPAFERIASHLVSANTKRIVHLDDRASFFLAGRIAKFAYQHGVTVDIVSAKALQDSSTSNPQIGGTTIVAAAAMATGRGLSEVSKSLRFAQEGGAIKYFIAYSRPKDAELSKCVQRDLSFGKNDPSEHYVAVMHEFYFPSWRPERKTAWEAEYEFLAKKLGPLPAELESRREQIRLAASTTVRGLSCGLFLPSRSNGQLTLRPGFAFWNFDYPVNLHDKRAPSQADVYATIVAVLHNLRNSKRSAERSLRQSDHVRRVISPRCFERFNDGIIQASFLRAAHVAEIDYSVDDLLSEDMRSIIATILDQRLTSVGEASNEFLLALALGRLRLCPTHMASLIAEFGGSTDDSVAQFLWETIRTRHSHD